jgi:hydroxymethylglutaryl-CoA lyase
VGYANPAQVARLFTRCVPWPATALACGHFHDTRGLGLANVYAAWQAGVRRFDACVGGIGGCPHAPGASGNVATEDLAWLFASMGVPTGLDFDKLIALRGRSPAGCPASRCTAHLARRPAAHADPKCRDHAA